MSSRHTQTGDIIPSTSSMHSGYRARLHPPQVGESEPDEIILWGKMDTKAVRSGADRKTDRSNKTLTNETKSARELEQAALLGRPRSHGEKREAQQKQDERKWERYRRSDDHNGKQEVWQEPPTQNTFRVLGTPPPVPSLNSALQRFQERSVFLPEFRFPQRHRGVPEASRGTEVSSHRPERDEIRGAGPSPAVSAAYSRSYNLYASPTSPSGRRGNWDYVEPAQQYRFHCYDPACPCVKLETTQVDTSRGYY